VNTRAAQIKEEEHRAAVMARLAAIEAKLDALLKQQQEATTNGLRKQEKGQGQG
jgi:hypothetical protein